VVRAALDDPSGLAAHQMYGLESDFNFVKGMVKERDAMAQKVGACNAVVQVMARYLGSNDPHPI
jgi:hypothetical protein